MSRERSDAERLARNRVLIAFLIIYLLSIGFLSIGDRLYLGTKYVIWTRLATIPFFLLLLRRWVRLVRVRPPELLVQARQLVALNKPAAAREKFIEAQRLAGPATTRLDRARRILQDGLAVTVEQETRIEQGRCSLLLGELERATSELGQIAAELPARSDVAIDLAEALARSGQGQRATEALQAALPYMDAVDVQTLREQPSLLRLVSAPLPMRSLFYRKVLLEKLLAVGLLAAALAHALHFYLRLF
jgi:hypothetical protein